MLKSPATALAFCQRKSTAKQKTKVGHGACSYVACRCASPVVSALARKKKIKIKNKSSLQKSDQTGHANQPTISSQQAIKIQTSIAY